MRLLPTHAPEMRSCVLLLLVVAVAVGAFRVIPGTGALRPTGARVLLGIARSSSSPASEAIRARALGLRLAAAEESGDKGEESTPAPSQEANKAVEEKKELKVLGFNLLDFNDWITIFLSGVIAVQTFGIVKDIIVGFTNK